MKKTATKGILLAVLATSLYALSAPLSKILLKYLTPTLMAGFLYLGAGLGMAIIALIVFREAISALGKFHQKTLCKSYS